MATHWPPRRMLTCAVFFGLIAAAQGTNSTNCYFPDGEQSNGSPCFPDDDVSACCGPGFICLSDGLCSPGPDTKRTYQYTYYRSSCTDQTWNSTSCPQVCLSSDDNTDAGQGLASCGNNTFCCGRSYDCCDNSTEVFSYGTTDAVTTIPYASSSTTTVIQPATHTAAAGSSTTTSSSSSSAGTSSSTSSSGLSNGAAIGVGVGVGVGGFAILCSFVLFFLARRRRSRSRGAAHKAELDAAAGGPPELPGSPGTKDQPPGYSSAGSPKPHEDAGSPNVTSPVSSLGAGTTGLTSGVLLNPAEMEAGPGTARYEIGAGREAEKEGAQGAVTRHELPT